MQRQSSILSFFQRSSSENHQSSGGSSDADMLASRRQSPSSEKQGKQKSLFTEQQTALPSANDSSFEIRGTDTPPEKLPRQILPSSFSVNDDIRPSLFHSIMHKFVKVDERDNSCGRDQAGGGSSKGLMISSNIGDNQLLSQHETFVRNSQKDSVCNSKDINDQGDFLWMESDPDDLGPETPGIRPLVPRLKRIQEDYSNSDKKSGSSLSSFGKRAKLLEDSSSGNQCRGDASETTVSKFEWLDPSLIRDANGRRPNDALYDKRTLYIRPDALKKMTASQKQYWSVKCQYMDVVLFFKVGKFYELYELDAEIGHKELDWKMTFSGVGKCRQVGISESGIDDAVQKLVARGYKVGRMEQIETSDQAKARGATSVIQRKLVNVITPSTTIDGNIGPDAVHLLALKEGDGGFENGSTVYGFAFADCAALKFWVGSICDDGSCAALGALLMQVSPKEVIYESRGLSKEAHKALKKYSSAGSTMSQSLSVAGFMDASEVRKLIHSKGYFRGSSNPWEYVLDGVRHHDLVVCTLGGLISHLSRLMLDDALHNGDILPYQVYRGCLRLDGQTLVNLEIFSNNADGSSSGTLYKYLDSCITSSGKRLLRSWICHPLKEVQEINDRLNVVEELMKNSEITSIMAQYLRKLPDLERLFGRVKATVRSSASLSFPMIGKKILKQRVKAFGSLIKGLRIGMDLLNIFNKEKHGFPSLSKMLDLPLLCGVNDLDELLTQLEAAVDNDFPKYQDHEVADSDADTLSVLTELFIERATQWSQVIHALNYIDVIRSFTMTANSSCGSMCRPTFLPAKAKPLIACQEIGGPLLKVIGLWHPYALGENGGTVVPNDIHLGEDATGYHPHTLLLTGPNMGGKSTLMRATCLAVILAQLGCYVPCKMLVLSPVDIIFTRLGATDRIMTGESTFFIECMETASVLQNSTQDSVVVLDELGRGTSTFDGYAIAYAVFRHLVEKVHCRLLFATHYHPLTKEFASHPHVTLQHMACTFKPKVGGSFSSDQELVFLYRLTLGACPESYGLQVALMAGIPRKVVEVASKASQGMKELIAKNFRSSEQRSDFSTLHEEWLKTLLAVSKTRESSLNNDDDAFDTLLCLWHELKTFYRLPN
ncbi:DNA mismatch repair protein MSH7 [Telopea speciosissima]|uniref:DNA mismatch repair protein MSH7 n=1 Tax=Telopea speciosissima TaxID=54955 RepID=UPI001CC4CDC6|nr:DNA mismatch repair protein MSH7 [Telopea speciosissima]XP_043702330.1 DNA mismatch repair protein MSH7 [Telopea speciosissima]